MERFAGLLLPSRNNNMIMKSMMRRLVILILLAGTLIGKWHAGEPAAPQGEDTKKGQQQHWAYGPVSHPQPLAVRGSARTAVDRFILGALEAKGLTVNPEAERSVLIRRASFDLTGLPPAPAEVDAFLADRTPNGYERMLD